MLWGLGYQGNVADQSAEQSFAFFVGSRRRDPQLRKVRRQRLKLIAGRECWLIHLAGEFSFAVSQLAQLLLPTPLQIARD
jgi:hypothetical protein